MGMPTTKIVSIIVIIAVVASIALFLRAKSAFFAYHTDTSGITIIRDVVYVPGSTNPKHKLDLYLPKGAKNYPLVYFVHGGNWNSGDKNYNEWLTGLYGSIGVTLAKQGVGVAVANYRLYPEAHIEDMVSDVAAGANFVIAHTSEYGWRSDIYLMGHSAGGHLVSLPMKDNPPHVSGVIALSPILDVPAMTADSKEDFKQSVIYPIFGTSTPEQLRYSPMTYWQHGAPGNLCVIVGGNDDTHIRVRGVALAHATVIPGYVHTDMVVKIGSHNDLVTPEILKCLQTFTK